jgi:hypothetical protein
VAAISLAEKHRQEAERLRAQVVRATADPPQASKGRMLDKRELRGWPAAGKGISGHISGTEPGHGLFDE